MSLISCSCQNAWTPGIATATEARQLRVPSNVRHVAEVTLRGTSCQGMPVVVAVAIPKAWWVLTSTSREVNAGARRMKPVPEWLGRPSFMNVGRQTLAAAASTSARGTVGVVCAAARQLEKRTAISAPQPMDLGLTLAGRTISSTPPPRSPASAFRSSIPAHERTSSGLAQAGLASAKAEVVTGDNFGLGGCNLIGRYESQQARINRAQHEGDKMPFLEILR